MTARPSGVGEPQVRTARANVEHIPDALDWVLAATWPPMRWLLGDSEERAREVLASWMQRENSEAWIGLARLLLEKGRAVGGFISLPCAEVAARRRADTMALIAAVDRSHRGELRARLSAAAELQLPLDSDAYYLSRLGVAPAYRGRGFARRLLDLQLAAGNAVGFTRFRLDVAGSNDKAVRLYETHGFRACGERRAAGMSTIAMVLERS